MAIAHADAIGEQTLTSGTGTLTLSGTALTAHRTFAASVTAGGLGNITDGGTTEIRIDVPDANGNQTDVWEECESVYDVATNTVTRGTLLSSSTGLRIDFPAGTKHVRVAASGKYLDGLMTGPSSAVDNLLMAYDGTTGKLSKATNILSGFSTTSPNDTVPVASLLAYNASYTDIDFAAGPKGNGAFMLQIPDGTTAGGNKRGIYAVDLQLFRTAADQVASGSSAFAAGRSCKASSAGSISIGDGTSSTNTSTIGIGTTVSVTASRGIGIGNNITNSSIYGIGIGAFLTLSGSNTGALGYRHDLAGSYSYAMGYRCDTTSAGSYTFIAGIFVKSSATRAIAIGVGVNNTNRLNNNVARSIWFAANSTVPSLAIWNAGGTGLFGKVSIGSATAPTDDSIFEVVSTTKAARPFPVMTATELGLIATPGLGMMATDSTALRPNFYDTAWRVLAYNPMTTAGDIIYGGVSGLETRLPKGTASQQLRMNAGATAPEWFTPTSVDTGYLNSFLLMGG